MVKLATVRESRSYGPRLSGNQFEYVNAGLYILASILLIGGLAAQFSIDGKSGLAVLLVGLVLMIVVNIHDLIAQMVGIDFRFVLMKLDLQLALVEFAVPCVQALGSILTLLGILLVLIQVNKTFTLLFRYEGIARGGSINVHKRISLLNRISMHG